MRIKRVEEYNNGEYGGRVRNRKEERRIGQSETKCIDWEATLMGNLCYEAYDHFVPPYC